jgi:hypothetical protein
VQGSNSRKLGFKPRSRTLAPRVHDLLFIQTPCMLPQVCLAGYKCQEPLSRQKGGARVKSLGRPSGVFALTRLVLLQLMVCGALKSSGSDGQSSFIMQAHPDRTVAKFFGAHRRPSDAPARCFCLWRPRESLPSFQRFQLFKIQSCCPLRAKHVCAAHMYKARPPFTLPSFSTVFGPPPSVLRAQTTSQAPRPPPRPPVRPPLMTAQLDAGSRWGPEANGAVPQAEYAQASMNGGVAHPGLDQPALVGGALVDEYDPARPNDYEEYVAIK